jgi:hypothetical protein
MMDNETPAAPRRRYMRRQPKVETIEEVDESLANIAAIDSAPPLTPMRPPLRDAMREEDPRAAAERRTAEILGHLPEAENAADEFYAPKPPDGWSYEWKRRTVYNAEDPAYQVQLRQTGWEPVPVSRHPEMMPAGWKGKEIERKGMVLMERPKEITDRIMENERMKARKQVRAKEEQLSAAPQGQFDRDHPQAKPKIKKGYEPMPIPE